MLPVNTGFQWFSQRLCFISGDHKHNPTKSVQENGSDSFSGHVKSTIWNFFVSAYSVEQHILQWCFLLNSWGHNHCVPSVWSPLMLIAPAFYTVGYVEEDRQGAQGWRKESSPFVWRVFLSHPDDLVRPCFWSGGLATRSQDATIGTNPGSFWDISLTPRMREKAQECPKREKWRPTAISRKVLPSGGHWVAEAGQGPR